MADTNPATQLARAYSRGCSELGLVPVAEFVRVLNAPPSQRSAGVACVLSDVKNAITDRDLVSISTSLQQCNFITSLDLANNSIGAGGVEHLCAALQQSTSIKHLGLSNNDLRDEGLIRVAQFIRENDSLRTLVLDQVNASAKGVAAIMASLSENSSVHTLSLAANQIPPKGGHAIAQVLRLGVNLRSLGLADNQLGDAGVVPIAAAIAAPACKLTELDIQRNGINGMGAGALGEALSRGAVLRTVNLAGNVGIGGDGLSNLVRSFSLSPSLLSVNLDGVGFTRDSGAALADTLGKNPPLKELRIAGLTQLALAQDLAVSMGSNITLVRLELSDKMARTEPGQRIDAICAVNRKIAGWESTPSALQQRQQQPAATAAASAADRREQPPHNPPQQRLQQQFLGGTADAAGRQQPQEQQQPPYEKQQLERRMAQRQAEHDRSQGQHQQRQRPPLHSWDGHDGGQAPRRPENAGGGGRALGSTIRDIQRFAATGGAAGLDGHPHEEGGGVRVPPQMERMFMQWMDSRQSQWEQRYEAQQDRFEADISRHEATIAQLGEQLRWLDQSSADYRSKVQRGTVDVLERFRNRIERIERHCGLHSEPLDVQTFFMQFSDKYHGLSAPAESPPPGSKGGAGPVGGPTGSGNGDATAAELEGLQSSVDTALRRLETYMERQVAKDAHAASAGSEWQEALHAHRVKLEIGLRRVNGRMRAFESRLDGVESELVSEKTNSLQALDAILQHAKKV